MLAPTKNILSKAYKNNYAVPHFNVNNMEMVQGVVQAAVNTKSPIILATSEGAIKYAGINFLFELVKTASELVKVPIALHLDHGRNLDVIKKCIDLGYSSVMVDGSHLDFENNIRLTKKVVDWAHKKNISVEAELGTIGGAEDTIKSRQIIYTNPDKAKEFISQTRCDFLAVAIGTSHGAYKFNGKAELNMKLLKEIKTKCKIPLVLHGASGVPSFIVKMAEMYGAKLSGVKGVPDTEIKKAVKNGINKINTDTDLRIAFDAAIRKFLSNKPKDFDPRDILSPARELITRVAEHRIKICGSTNKI